MIDRTPSGWPDRISHTGKGPKGYRRSDERIREDVCELLERDGEIDASDIEVGVLAGEVTLEGQVDERRTKWLAEQLCDLVPGVSDVHNRLRLVPRSVDGGPGEGHEPDTVDLRGAVPTPGGTPGSKRATKTITSPGLSFGGALGAGDV